MVELVITLGPMVEQLPALNSMVEPIKPRLEVEQLPPLDFMEE